MEGQVKRSKTHTISESSYHMKICSKTLSFFLFLTLAYRGSSGKLAIFFPRAVRRAWPSFLSTAPSSSKCSTAERTDSKLKIKRAYYQLIMLFPFGAEACGRAATAAYLERAWTWNRSSSHLEFPEPWAAASHPLSCTCGVYGHKQAEKPGWLTRWGEY